MQNRAVDCSCPEGMLLAVLDTLPGNRQLLACVRCGRVELSDALVNEPHPSGVQFLGYEWIALSEAVRSWAGSWPRFALLSGQRVYLSAQKTFETEAELVAAIELAAVAQISLMLREKLLQLGVPTACSPESLPEALSGFAEIWNALQWNDQTPIELVLAAANRFHGPHRLAREFLAELPDLAEQAGMLLEDSDEEVRSWGRYLVKEFALHGDAILIPIRERLGQLTDNSSSEMYEIFALLRKMGNNGMGARAEVAAAMERVAESDHYMHKDLLKLLASWQS